MGGGPLLSTTSLAIRTPPRSPNYHLCVNMDVLPDSRCDGSLARVCCFPALENPRASSMAWTRDTR